jgi:hypothetical protein
MENIKENDYCNRKNRKICRPSAEGPKVKTQLVCKKTGQGQGFCCKARNFYFRLVFTSTGVIFLIMKSAGPLLIAVTLLFPAGAWAQDFAASDKPYASIVSRNMFGLLPIPPAVPANAEPPKDPPPKITPNGIMTIFGKVQALFKVTVKGQAGQPPKDESYVLSEGERQDDIEVVKINQDDGIITFDNHGEIQPLPLVAASNSTAPAAAPGGPPLPRGAGFNPGRPPGQVPFAPAQRGVMRGREVGQNNPNNNGNVAAPNFGGNNFQTTGSQTPTIEDQALNAAQQMARIEQERIATQEEVIQGKLPPLPPTLLTPPDAEGAGGSPLIVK